MIFKVRQSPDDADTGFLENFPDRCLDKRLRERVPRAGYRLPETGTIGPFDQQDVQFSRVDDDQNRLWNFIRHIHHKKGSGNRSLSFLMPVEPFLFFSGEYAVPATVFH